MPVTTRPACAKRPFRGWTKVLFAVILLLSASPARAGTCNPTDTAGQTLAFGTWLQPSSGSSTADVTTTDVRSGTGTFLSGTPVHGVFTLATNGANCSGTITITVTDTGGASGVTLSNFHLDYNGSAITNGQSGLVLPGAGKTLLVGATATFTSSVSIGAAVHPTFNIHILESGHSATNDTTGSSNIAFDVPITITKNSDINFGTVKQTASTYTMSTAGVITATGSGAYLYGTKNAGSLTIGGSTTSTITISVGNLVASGGLTPSNIKGAYNGGAAVSFPMNGVAAPGAGKTLLLGVDLVTTGSEATGTTFTPSFDVTVAYP